MCRFVFFAILFIWCSAIGTRAQPCIPEPVETVAFSSAGLLTWAESENCPKTTYTVLIQTTSGAIEYEYNVDTLTLDVSFLKLCTNYTFTIIPTSDHILGGETSTQGAINIPANVVINILNFTGAQLGEDVLIQWEVNENYTACVTYYHLQTWSEDSTDPESLYVGQTGHLIEHVAQCMTYQFELQVYFDNRNNTVQKFNFTVPEEPNNLSLIALRQDTSVINSTWRLEPYRLNRCNVTALLVNGTHFNEVYPIVDEPERPDLDISITDLKPNSMYYFNVSTINTAGVSDPFQISVQTLPEEEDELIF